MNIPRVGRELLLNLVFCTPMILFFFSDNAALSQDKPLKGEASSQAPALVSAPAGGDSPTSGQAIEVKFEAGKLSVKADKADLTALLKKVSEAAGIAVEVGAGVIGTVSLTFSDLGLEEGIKRILETADAENYLAAFDRDVVERDGGGFTLRKIVVSRRVSGDLSPATAKKDTRPAIELLCLNSEEKESLGRDLGAILSSLSRQDEKKMLKDLEKIEKLAYVDLCGEVVRQAVPVILGLLKEYPDPGTEYEKKFKKFDEQRIDEYFDPTINTKARVALLWSLGMIADKSVLEYLERIKNTSPAVIGWGELSQTGEGGAASRSITLINGKQRFLDNATSNNTEDIIQKLMFDMKYSQYQTFTSRKSKEYSELAAKVYPLIPSYQVQAFVKIGKPAVLPLVELYEESIRLEEDAHKKGIHRLYETGYVMHWCLESLGEIGDPSVLPILEKYKNIPESKDGRYGSNLTKTIEILKAKRR